MKHSTQTAKGPTKKVKKHSPVEVSWIDSIRAGGWHDHEDADMNCTTVGLLIEKKKDRVVIAQNRSAYGDGDYMEIPLVAVKRIRRLK